MATVMERARVANLAAVWRTPEISQGLTKRERAAIESWTRSAEIEVPSTVARALARVPDLREQALARREAELRRRLEEARQAEAQEPVQEPARATPTPAPEETSTEAAAAEEAPANGQPTLEPDEERRKPRWLRR